MKNGIIILFLISSFYSAAQFKQQGLVKDGQTKEPIPFCAIAFKGSSQGYLSNSEGVFQLIVPENSDTLFVTCIGYKKKAVSISTFLKDPVIYLQVSELNLQEVIIYDKNDFLLEAFDLCRKKLASLIELKSKTYFVLESAIAQQPVELLECYYNGSFNNSSLHSLEFKNGRVGLAPYNDRFFINANISKAFTFLNLIGGNPDLPKNPFEFNTRQLRKNYHLKLISISENENKLYHIEFKPINESGDFFSGEVWIESKTGNLQKISLYVSKTRKHPFLPLFKGEGSIDNVSIQINKSFNLKNDSIILDHIDFNYQLMYKHFHNQSLLNSNKDTNYMVTSKGLMYFYDIGKPFILPYFSYDSEFSDYNKIASLSYNENFWNTNTSVEYSQNMKKGIMYFKKNGILLNYKNGQNTDRSFLNKGKFFENNYLLWSADKRISLKKDKLINDTLTSNSTNGQHIRTQLYQIKAQLFLDLNPVKDSIQHFSASIFDVYETFYNLPEEPVTNCFINIYFDLFEIERRKMETLISKNKLTASQIDSIYKSSIKNLEIQTREYFSEVERGHKLKALEKWNGLVKQNLGIDNMAIFQILNGSK